MFQLSENEYSSLTSQIVMSKKGCGGRRVLPFVFTGHGVLMLSSVLNSDRAIEVNIQVMRIFTKIRQMLFNNTELRLEIEKINSKINNQTQYIFLIRVFISAFNISFFTTEVIHYA
ncbi:ORF6N domain-containing protein [Mucilaginibacter aquariorum]|uniref:ORF6N domain-containing protein n=1 Tax=Mucilaginibacter aquariorum TaxID=2967225 RepID=UPI00339019D3